MRLKSLAAAAAITVMTTGGMVAIASPASAWVYCGASQACLYYNSNLEGAYLRQGTNIENYAGYYFSGTGLAGAGSSVKNNAASVDNDDAYYRFRVFENSGTSGRSQTFATYSSGNLNSIMKNNNGSGKFVP